MPLFNEDSLEAVELNPAQQPPPLDGGFQQQTVGTFPDGTPIPPLPVGHPLRPGSGGHPTSIPGHPGEKVLVTSSGMRVRVRPAGAPPPRPPTSPARQPPAAPPQQQVRHEVPLSSPPPRAEAMPEVAMPEVAMPEVAMPPRPTPATQPASATPRRDVTRQLSSQVLRMIRDLPDDVTTHEIVIGLNDAIVQFSFVTLEARGVIKRTT